LVVLATAEKVGRRRLGFCVWYHVRLWKPHVAVPSINQYIEVTRQSSGHTIHKQLYNDYTYTTIYLYKYNTVIYSNNTYRLCNLCIRYLCFCYFSARSQKVGHGSRSKNIGYVTPQIHTHHNIHFWGLSSYGAVHPHRVLGLL
jgi:hypothetical protein